VRNWEGKTGLKWAVRVFKLSRPRTGSTASLYMVLSISLDARVGLSLISGIFHRYLSFTTFKSMIERMFSQEI